MSYTQLRDYIENNSNGLISLENGFEDVAENLPFPVILIDNYYTILYTNKMFSKFSGLYMESIIGRDYFKTVYGANEPEANCPVQMCIETGVTSQGEVYHKLAKRWLRNHIQKTNIKSEDGNSVFIVLLEDISKDKMNQIRLEKNILRQKAITESGIKAICRIIEARDAYTASHQEKVGKIAYRIAKELGKSDEYASGIQAAGMLHDVGKITVPIEILCKPIKINPLEFEVIKSHPIAGHSMLRDIIYNIPIADIALQHHERIDGSGYPYGLKGDEIHESTKIVSVADVVDAITSHRPYREARSMETAIEHLKEGAGKIYDKDCAEITIMLCEKGIIRSETLKA